MKDQFLNAAWHWGDREQAARLLVEVADQVTQDIFVACAALDRSAVASLLEEKPSRARKKGGPRKWPPILYASWSCFLAEREDDARAVLSLLLDAGADPNSSWRNRQFKVDESALYGAVGGDSLAAARVLLEAGARPSDGESLYHCCEKSSVEWLELLGAHGLEHDELSYCIKHAMDFGFVPGILWFLEQDADPDAIHPRSGETSLHWAIKRNNPMCVIEALLEHGADANARTARGRSAFLDIKGLTPRDFARRLGRSDVAAVLAKAGGEALLDEPTDRFVIACANGEESVARQSLEEFPDLVNRLDDADRRLVAHVAQMRNWHGVRLMLDLGWPLEASGWMDARPLTWALCFGVPEMVDDLLGRGASLEPAGDYFKDPLHTVEHCLWGFATAEDREQCRRLLVSEIEARSE